MDEDWLKERGEDHDYPEEAIDDLLVLNSFIGELQEFLGDLLDEESLSGADKKRATLLLNTIEEGLLEQD